MRERIIAEPRLADGRVVYALKKQWRNQTTYVVLRPELLIERLLELVPRPRKHLVNYHGVLAPAAELRSRVVPDRGDGARRCGVARLGRVREAVCETRIAGPGRYESRGNAGKLLPVLAGSGLARCGDSAVGYGPSVRYLLILALLAAAGVYALFGLADPAPMTDLGSEEHEAPDSSAPTVGGGDPDAASAGELQREAALPTTGLRVRVFADGLAAAAVEVAAWSQKRFGGWSKDAFGITDEEGVVTLAVSAGSYRIGFAVSGVARQPLKKRYAVLAGELRDVTIRLPRPCTVTGCVLDADGRPLPGVEIGLQNKLAAHEEFGRVVSDLAGRFTVSHLAPGSTTLRCVHPRFVERDVPADELIAGRTLDIGEVRMSRGPALRGRVVDRQQNPLAGAKVRIVDVERSVTTDDLGAFQLDRVADGAVLYVECDDHIARHVAIGSGRRWLFNALCWTDTSKSFDIELSRSLCLKGKVTSDRHPVKVKVLNYGEHSCWSSSPKVDEQGNFVAERLHPGKTEIQAWVAGFGYSEQVTIEVEEDQQQKVSLTVQSTRSLQFAVVDDVDAPVAGAEITIDGYGDDDLFPSIFSNFDNVETRSTDADGGVEFAGVLDGKWRIMIKAAGHLPRKIDLELRPETGLQTLRLVRTARLEVMVHDVPEELADDLRVYCRRMGDEGDRRAWSLRKAAAGLDLRPGDYEVSVGPSKYSDAMLGERAASMPAKQLTLPVSETTTCEISYRAMPVIRGRLAIPPYVDGAVSVYAMRPETWKKRLEHAHFIEFNLNLYGRRAICEPDGSFVYRVGELGHWVFVARFPTAPMPVQVGELQVTGDETPTFWARRGVVRGILHPDYRSADGKWPELVMMPLHIARNDPFHRMGALDYNSAPDKNLIERFRLRPKSNGAFVIGPLPPGSWSLTIRDERRLLLARKLVVDDAPIDLGTLSKPAAGTLRVSVTNARSNLAATLMPAGSEAGEGTFLMSVSCKDGELKFEHVPFGSYRLEIGKQSWWASLDSEVGFDIQHTDTGVEPSTIEMPAK